MSNNSSIKYVWAHVNDAPSTASSAREFAFIFTDASFVEQLRFQGELFSDHEGASVRVGDTFTDADVWALNVAVLVGGPIPMVVSNDADRASLGFLHSVSGFDHIVAHSFVDVSAFRAMLQTSHVEPLPTRPERPEGTFAEILVADQISEARELLNIFRGKFAAANRFDGINVALSGVSAVELFHQFIEGEKSDVASDLLSVMDADVAAENLLGVLAIADFALTLLAKSRDVTVEELLSDLRSLSLNGALDA